MSISSSASRAHGGTVLVISREIHESLMIGDDLQLQVVKVRGTTPNLRITRSLVGGRMTEELFSGWLEKDRSLDLGNGIVCAVVDVRDSKVRLGIQAPKEISIHRKEVYDAIRRTQQ